MSVMDRPRTQTGHDEQQNRTIKPYCAFEGCLNREIDPRGGVNVRNLKDQLHVCTPHWEAIFEIIGTQR